MNSLRCVTSQRGDVTVWPSLPVPSSREQSRTTSTVGVPQVALAHVAAAAVQSRIRFAISRRTPVVESSAQSLLPGSPGQVKSSSIY